MLTFIIFPGAFLDSYFDFINNSDIEENKKTSWYFILLTLLFNVCDTIGRYIGGAWHLPSRVIIIMSVVRTVFALTTTLIAFGVDPAWLFRGDVFKVINMVLFALTNGYVST
jgi:hypothetical protein